MKRSWWERFKADAMKPTEPTMLGMPMEYYEHRARKEEAEATQDILFQIFQELARIAAAMEESNRLLKGMAGADVYEVRRDGDGLA